MHNGLIREFASVKRDLAFAVDPSLYAAIEGSTDSELFFYVALTFGLEDDPPAAVERAVGFIEETGGRHGVEHPIQMTVCTTDGASVWAFRYSSEGSSRSLYYSTRVDTLKAQYPDNPVLHGALRRDADRRVRAAGRSRGRLERGARIQLRRGSGGTGRAEAVHSAACLMLASAWRMRRPFAFLQMVRRPCSRSPG
jgi:hypothetical protein